MVRVTQSPAITLDAGLAMYDQGSSTAVVHPTQFLLHNRDQNIQQRRSHRAGQDVLLIRARARLICSQQSRLRNGQRNRVFLGNLGEDDKMPPSVHQCTPEHPPDPHDDYVPHT